MNIKSLILLRTIIPREYSSWTLLQYTGPSILLQNKRLKYLKADNGTNQRMRLDKWKSVDTMFTASNFSSSSHYNTKSAKQLFEEVFPEIVKSATVDLYSEVEQLKPVLERFAEVVKYNVPHGKKSRGLVVMETYKHINPDASNEQIHKAIILGWCVEMLQAYYLVTDDIMDESIMRRGQLCWYKQDNVGNVAINDAIFMNVAIYHIIKQYFHYEDYYIYILELFHEINLRTIVGQGLDLLSSQTDGAVHLSQTDGAVHLSRFSMDNFNAIVLCKTSYYSFYLPVALAMHMSGINDKSSHDVALTILLKLGHFFQVKDDYIDCFGDPSVIGKVGTDIQNNKCSWLINRALALCSSEQRIILDENYGRNDPDRVAKVKAVYEELELKREFENYEGEIHGELCDLVEEDSGGLPKVVYYNFMAKVFKS